MKVLVVGGGGREHVIAARLAASESVDALFIAPGNAGTGACGMNVAIPVSDIEGLIRFVRNQGIDLTVVGPEQPLVEGIADRFDEEGLAVVGPRAAAAQLEGSKVFAKDFMARYGIPTAAYKSFDRADIGDAFEWVASMPGGCVIKADGLAAGKGVLICSNPSEGMAAVRSLLIDGAFGDAGSNVVIEEFMEGEEASVFALTDGETYKLLLPAQDHKRIGDGDKGPNTGGMGAYAPAPVMTEALLESVCRTIIEPTLDGMRADGHPYHGFLYVGLMMTEEGPKVVEFNCRLGDPEAQVVLPMIDGDFGRLMMATAGGVLAEAEVKMHDGAAVCLVAAAAGYPARYEKGFSIKGLEAANAMSDVEVFHAGTSTLDGGLVTSGGRVLGVTARAPDLETAIEHAYTAMGAISFDGMQYRSDIGAKGLRHYRDSA